MSAAATLFPRIIAAAAENGSFTDRMQMLIAHCEQQIPHNDWSKLRRVDYEADTKALEGWLGEALAKAPPGEALQGLWFGLCNPLVDDETTADIYIAASTEYSSGSIDWAVEASFFPENGFLNSRVLSEVYRLAYSDPNGLGNEAEYPLALAYGAMAARAALESSVSLLPRELLGAAAGFDSGDFLFLGTFQHRRFKANVTAG